MSSLALKTAAKGNAWYDRWMMRVPERQLQGVHASWRLWGRSEQNPPKGEWRTWLILAGRGFGKTRAGAEWVHALASNGDGGVRIALVGATADDVRRVMVEGESGLLSVGLPGERPRWEPSLGRLIWPSGAQAAVYGGSHPDALRGPQHHYAWCDEIMKWPYPGESWENLQLGLRLGEAPRVVATTTPRPGAFLKKIIDDAGTILTNGRMADNVVLSKAFSDWVTQQYAGTRLGRQELDGELIEDVAGALWTRDMLELCRVRACAAPRRVVVGVDPPASASGDACGIVCVALGIDGCGYVIEDASVSGLPPEGWAGVVADVAARHGADRIIAEGNNGGNMVTSVLRAADSGLPVKLVHASRGKAARAEPVAALYGCARVFHVGAFPVLEDEMCGMVQGGDYEGPGRSPDRADALVWALTELMLGQRTTEPRVRVI